jgi:hypothetical protein
VFMAAGVKIAFISEDHLDDQNSRRFKNFQAKNMRFKH